MMSTENNIFNCLAKHKQENFERDMKELEWNSAMEVLDELKILKQNETVKTPKVMLKHLPLQTHHCHQDGNKRKLRMEEFFILIITIIQGSANMTHTIWVKML